jgi:protease-4
VSEKENKDTSVKDSSIDKTSRTTNNTSALKNADDIMGLRSARKKLLFWRMFTFLSIFVCIGIFASFFYDGKMYKEDYIALITIDGMILSDKERIEDIIDIANDSSAKALIVSIDSPGGTTVASEDLYNAIRKVGNKKPVVSVMGGVAASGGYIVALASDHIIARKNTITGSIGVIMQWPEVHEAMKKIGINYNEIRSVPLKATPSPFHKANDNAVIVMQEMVNESHKWFVDLFSSRRRISPEDANIIADGRVYSGMKALDNGMIDSIGDDNDAILWLNEKHNISKNFPIVEKKDDKNLFEKIASGDSEFSILSFLPYMLSSFGFDVNSNNDGLMIKNTSPRMMFLWK